MSHLARAVCAVTQSLSLKLYCFYTYSFLTDATCSPSQVERLGDSRQPIRQQALHVLVSMFSSLRADFVWDKLSQHWPHKNWKVRHGLLEVLAEANIKLGTGALLTKDQGASPMVKQVIKLLDDNEGWVVDDQLSCPAACCAGGFE